MSILPAGEGAPAGGRRAALRQELAARGLAPNRRLGQHFMVDASALTVLVDALALAPGDRVLEVGPGTGLLTTRLLERGAVVLAVEIDRGLAALLADRFAAELAAGRLTLVHGDVLAGKNGFHPAVDAWAAAGPWLLGANLPYDAALPVMLNALALPRPPRRLVVTVQREAAERLTAAPGTSAWGASAAIAQAAGSGGILRRLGPASFEPRPRVSSALLAWEPVRILPAGFPRWCRDVFAYRRKRVVRALRDLGIPADRATAIADDAHLAPDRRLETCTVPELLALHRGCVAVAEGRSPP